MADPPGKVRGQRLRRRVVRSALPELQHEAAGFDHQPVFEPRREDAVAHARARRVQLGLSSRQQDVVAEPKLQHQQPRARRVAERFPDPLRNVCDAT